MAEQTKTYAEWKQKALTSDERSGRAFWRKVEHSKRYDYKTIRYRLDELRHIRDSDDPHRLLFYLHEGVHGDMGGMASSKLYGHARFGTKDLITDYISELCEAIEAIARVDDEHIPFLDKVQFFERASSCFGRSALMFSGAGSLGPFHLGVARALHVQGILPTVLSGASAGALVAAMIGTRTESELEELWQETAFFEPELEPGRRIEVSYLEAMLEDLIPDLTFEEAFDLSGRKINISVAPSELFQRSRLLNAVTSPNVFIREAVMASCAIPGVFPAVTLAAKNVDGERQAYIRSRKWVDGSVTDDQPAKRLARLYGVNHFISSQANPVVLWALRDTGWKDTTAGRLWDIYQTANKEWLRATYPLAVEVTRGIYPLNVLTRFGYGVATQDYTADINIMPRQRFWDPSKLLAVLSEEETQALVEAGEQATFPKIEAIRNASIVGITIDRLRDAYRERLAEESHPLSRASA